MLFMIVVVVPCAGCAVKGFIWLIWVFRKVSVGVGDECDGKVSSADQMVLHAVFQRSATAGHAIRE